MIPIAKPMLGEEEVAAARDAILSGWVSQGPRVAAFELAFAKRTSTPHACATSSGTTALHLALLATGVSAGDEVVTVSHSFIATANVIRYCGAEPVFVDIDADTYNIDASQVEAAIGSRTKAILAVHQMGMPCDLATLAALARQHGIALIEDAACAIGSEILWSGQWQPIGRPQSDAACFSFHPRKVITTGDGGMITTRNADWDSRFRRWRQHGMSIPDLVRHDAAQVIFEDYPEFGYNYRLTDIQAAVGITQLTRLDHFVTERRRLAERYRTLLTAISAIRPPLEPPWARSNWQSYCIRLPAGLDQRTVMQSMLDRGISTRRGIMNAHRERPYRNGRHSPLPQSERAQDQCILLPLYVGMSEDDQERIVEALHIAIN